MENTYGEFYVENLAQSWWYLVYVNTEWYYYITLSKDANVDAGFSIVSAILATNSAGQLLDTDLISIAPLSYG